MHPSILYIVQLVIENELRGTFGGPQHDDPVLGMAPQRGKIIVMGS